MSDIKEITEALIKFRNERDWEQFHNPKDLAVALNIEAGELLENFLWKSQTKQCVYCIAPFGMLRHHTRYVVKHLIRNKTKLQSEKKSA